MIFPNSEQWANIYDYTIVACATKTIIIYISALIDLSISLLLRNYANPGNDLREPLLTVGLERSIPSRNLLLSLGKDTYTFLVPYVN